MFLLISSKYGSKWLGGIENVYHDPCQDWLDLTIKKLTSPNYPELYDPNTVCTWNLTTNKLNYISLEFEYIGVGYGSDDYIKLYDSTDDGKSTVIASLTSSDEGPRSNILYWSYWQKKIISSTGNKMLVEFRSDDSFERDGFSASIHYSPLPSKECDRGLDMTMKTIQSPNYPDSYDNNLACKWLISVPHGSHISLKFLQLDVGFLVISMSDSFHK